MGTKNNPGKFDCYANALPDEPMFVLLARDPMAPPLVRLWAENRAQAIVTGDRSVNDIPMVVEAMNCAADMTEWRATNDGAWRKRDAVEAVDTAEAVDTVDDLPGKIETKNVSLHEWRKRMSAARRYLGRGLYSEIIKRVTGINSGLSSSIPAQQRSAVRKALEERIKAIKDIVGENVSADQKLIVRLSAVLDGPLTRTEIKGILKRYCANHVPPTMFNMQREKRVECLLTLEEAHRRKIAQIANDPDDDDDD